MRILVYASDFFPTIGGVQTAVMNLAREWSSRGHAVHIVTSRPSPHVARREVVGGLEVSRFDWQRRPIASLPFRALRISREIAPFVRRWQPDVVYAHFLPTNVAALLLVPGLAPHPLIVSARGNDVMGMADRSRVHRWAITRLFRKADSILFCSEALQRHSRTLLAEAGRTGGILGDGVDVKQVDAATPWSADYPYLFTGGRFVHKKGFDLLIEAFAEVHKVAPELRLMIAGDGPARPRIEERVRDLQLEKSVELTGFLGPQDLLGRMKGSEFFVLPSREEPFGIVVLEAMAASKPVLAANVDNIPRLITDGHNGLLAEPSVSSLRDGILRMLRSRESWEDWGARARSSVVEKHSWSRVADQALEIFAETLESRRHVGRPFTAGLGGRNLGGGR
ncbi:MAG: glycosyltransferase family 1 protein [Chloroflexota bacterium]|nr:MAG: glycosyltransferase family 1 protein [Chloroflexota bacterium]